MHGGAYQMSEEELIESHKAHDLDGNGMVTKDEVLWSRRLKGMFFKTMRLTEELTEIFTEDLDKFLELPKETQNAMIVAKAGKVKKSIKSESALEPLFKAADVHGRGKLNFKEWKVFSAALGKKMADKFGASYSLTDD